MKPQSLPSLSPLFWINFLETFQGPGGCQVHFLPMDLVLWFPEFSTFTFFFFSRKPSCPTPRISFLQHQRRLCQLSPFFFAPTAAESVPVVNKPVTPFRCTPGISSCNLCSWRPAASLFCSGSHAVCPVPSSSPPWVIPPCCLQAPLWCCGVLAFLSEYLLLSSGCSRFYFWRRFTFLIIPRFPRTPLRRFFLNLFFVHSLKFPNIFSPTRFFSILFYS